MFKLRYGYLISGIITGSILLLSFFTSLPDGKLHIIFCNIGQGDAAYIKFPDGRDMIIDGGPDEKIIGCLSRHMPFWDRHIDIVALSHPQKDHLQGLISVFARYHVDYFLKSDIGSGSDGYRALLRGIADRRVSVKQVTRGERISIGSGQISVIWPSEDQISRMHSSSEMSDTGVSGNILGSSSDANLNDGSLVFWLRYGTFDALFPGDADQHVEHYYTGEALIGGDVEVLKVPHHGSKTGMTQAFIDWLHPKIAVISVGKNSYGHPSKEAIDMLQNIGSVIHRTDIEGDIEVVSDGTGWIIR